jgi:hypothetical protein
MARRKMCRDDGKWTTYNIFTTDESTGDRVLRSFGQ